MVTNIKSKTGLYLFGAVFIIIGIVMAISMLGIYKSESKKNKEWIQTPAVIQDITRETYRSNGKYKTDHDVYIAYTYKGMEYEGMLNYYSSSMNIGNEVTIYVNPNNPNEHSSGVVLPFIIIGSVFGTIFPLVGISVIINTVKGNVVYVKGSHRSRL